MFERRRRRKDGRAAPALGVPIGAQRQTLRWIALIRVFLVPAIAFLLVDPTPTHLGSALLWSTVFLLFAITSIKSSVSEWGWRVSGLALAGGTLIAVGTA